MLKYTYAMMCLFSAVSIAILLSIVVYRIDIAYHKTVAAEYTDAQRACLDAKVETYMELEK